MYSPPLSGTRFLLVLAAVAVSAPVAGPLARAAEPEKTRPAQCAGAWYPGDAGALTRLIDEKIAAAPALQIAGKPLALIGPHAGYQYSASVLGAGYASLRGQTYQRVIVLAFSHRRAGSYRGIDVPKDLTAYATPLGDVPLDRAACDELLKKPGFAAHAGVDAQEHSLELQLPFLQRGLKDFRLVPLLVGQMSDKDYTAAAQALLPLLDGDTLLVASSDFTHYGEPHGYVPFHDDVEAKLRDLAEQAAAPILRCDYDGFMAHIEKTGDTICGRGPIALLLRTLAMRGGAQAVRAALDLSGHQTGDWTNCVTYQSFVFTPRAGTLGAAEREQLLRLARETATAFLNGKPVPKVEPDELPAALRANGACFVTLQNHGQLRGCIGNMIAQGPLYQAVVQNALSACQDYRFVDNPVRAKELDQLHIEISYLTPLKRVTKTDEIVVGRHGLLITLGDRRGVLLPQVAYERGWTRAEFLAETCHKAGLPPDAWKKSEAQIDSFEAEVFGEPEKP